MGQLAPDEGLHGARTERHLVVDGEGQGTTVQAQAQEGIEAAIKARFGFRQKTPLQFVILQQEITSGSNELVLGGNGTTFTQDRLFTDK